MNKHLTIVFLSFSMIILTSCGKKDGGGGGNGTPGSPTLEEQVAEGSYRAILRPFNNSLSGFLPTGFAEIKIAGDMVEVKTLLDDDARVNHLQSIHTGTRCPQLTDDSNKDGLVDIEETDRASGKVFIPLDADINSATEGSGIYPMGGGFTYIQSASLAKLETDTKARTRQNLNLGGRVVILHGVAEGTLMPATVATRDGMTQQASVPIACGVLQRIKQ